MVPPTPNEVRSISHELLPPHFNGLSLSQLIAAYAMKSDGFVNYIPSDSPVSLDSEKSINLYRIIQEWISNLHRHSSATSATISLTRRDNAIILEITDDGQAFSPSSAPTGGLGLENINRRVKALCGTLSIDSKNAHNTLSVRFFI